jgi:2-C-methyl-D-erythritol 2,4-cyclodiphosphate synthase
MKYKTGHGYDVHRFEAGRKLILGGVEIAHEYGLAGHSDADVLVHAVIDALLGAAGLGDIGEIFPDSDAQYKDISSLMLLGRTVDMFIKDYVISNIDCTVLAERPKLAPYKEMMKRNLSEILQADVNIKATTTEGLGFTGRGEGIAAYAVCILEVRKENFVWL